MNNLALTFGALGRHADALAMKKQALEFRRRVLPANHPDTGEGWVACGVTVLMFFLRSLIVAQHQLLL
jgi:hypothetical protein